MIDHTISKLTAGKVVDVILPLFLLALLVALCIQLLLPFVGLLVWTSRRLLVPVATFPVTTSPRRR